MHTLNTDVVYLNLGHATARRDWFEAQYAACDFALHWTLRRFHAIDAQHELVKTAAGSLSPGNKGCIFSSLECLRQSFDDDRHLFILDDDIACCAETQRGVDQAISGMAEEDWDVLLTDTIIPNASDMPKLLMLWHEFQQTKALRLIDLQEGAFNFCAGSTITNRQSKRKIHALMTAASYDVPWDIAMRNHIRQKRLKAVLVFPFLTAASRLGDQSQIKPDHPDKVEHALDNAFRRMMWVGDTPQPYASEWAHQATRDVIEDDVVRFNAIMTPLLSIQLRQRWFRDPG